MKLVKLVCPNCNAKLEINSEMKQFTCNYCGTTTMLDDEVIKLDVKVKKNELDDAIEKLNTMEKYSNTNEYYNYAVEVQRIYPKNVDVKYHYINSWSKNFSTWNVETMLRLCNGYLDDNLEDQSKARIDKIKSIKSKCEGIIRQKEKDIEEYNRKKHEEYLKKVELEKQRKELFKTKTLPFIIKTAIIGVVLLIMVFSYPFVRKYIDYKGAESLYEKGEYEKASEEFIKLGNFLDSEEQYYKSNFEHGKELYEKKKYNSALSNFEIVKNSGIPKIDDYINGCNYELGKNELKEKNYEKAIEYFEKNIEYKDTMKYIEDAKYKYVRAHYNNEDSKTHTYLQDLISINKDKYQPTYLSLYKWTGSIQVMDIDKTVYSGSKAGIRHYPLDFVLTVKGGYGYEKFYWHYYDDKGNLKSTGQSCSLTSGSRCKITRYGTGVKTTYHFIVSDSPISSEKNKIAEVIFKVL